MLLTAVIAAFAIPALLAVHPWPLQVPFSVMDTLTTLQDYGGTPGFHHGLDLQAPAGTAVFAPVGGRITLDYYYPRARSPYTFRVSIEAADGRRWELHHVDPATVPAAVEAAATTGGTVVAGTFLARITDASAVGLPSHVHVEVIDRSGLRLDPLRFLPAVRDTSAPRILGVYVIDRNGHAVAQQAHSTARGVVALGRPYEVVIDAVDMISPGTWGDALYGLEVAINGRTVRALRFDALPDPDYLKGVTEVYRVTPFTDLDGRVVENQVDLTSPRHFLYRVPFESPARAGSLGIAVRAIDRSHNTTRLSVDFASR